MLWVEVYNRQDGVRAVRAGLRVGENLVVLVGVEGQALVALQRGIGATDVVELPDQRRDGNGVGAVPVA